MEKYLYPPIQLIHELAYGLRVSKNAVKDIIQKEDILPACESAGRGVLYLVSDVLKALGISENEYLQRLDCLDTREAVELLDLPEVKKAKDLEGMGFDRIRPGTNRFYWSRKQVKGFKETGSVSALAPVGVDAQPELFPQDGSYSEIKNTQLLEQALKELRDLRVEVASLRTDVINSNWKNGWNPLETQDWWKRTPYSEAMRKDPTGKKSALEAKNCKLPLVQETY